MNIDLYRALTDTAMLRPSNGSLETTIQKLTSWQMLALELMEEMGMSPGDQDARLRRNGLLLQRSDFPANPEPF
jgi:hypothetical protein